MRGLVLRVLGLLNLGSGSLAAFRNEVQKLKGKIDSRYLNLELSD